MKIFNKFIGLLKEAREHNRFKFWMQVMNVTWIFIGSVVILSYAIFLSDHIVRDIGLSIMTAAAGFKAVIQYFIK